ncbi:MgtC/SapB family protein [Alkalibacterium olivapovliticus]|uniref:Putative Mg2+ transporter-C (MgtC) family protein n=1 Tax=Alkalibacterium olivapovliticus TaxID=99907 RepID=A0A2T0W9Y0_9LACT|nr:MgtC/SapB family protein [Alkalibacterium olivapovliticus]PRY83518.1 putative Mg2+ transporter-C (MgtC) family protein [Alkalibacterium olivapovliticus]
MDFTQTEIFLRLILAAVVGGIIGYERELKGRDAGIRTHTLVSLGAAIITITQLEASKWVLEFAMANPEFSTILSSDITRLTAQIVNGIGFLGAGTIIVSRRTVTGLTTAASIWAVASLGIAVGMGYYYMAIASTLIMLIVLRLVKSLFKIERSKQLEVHYKNRDQTLKYLEQVFKDNSITVVSADHSITYQEDGTSICEDLYTLHLPSQFNMMQFISQVGAFENIIKIKTIKATLDN